MSADNNTPMDNSLPEPEVPEREPQGQRVDQDNLDRPLRKIRVNPAALSRAVVLANVIATEYGQTEEEKSKLAVFFRENEIIVAATLDEEATRTSEDQPRPRPMRFRFQVPMLDGGLQEGRAREVGTWVRGRDLLVALRNRVENSQNYGVLNEDEPVIIEVHGDTDKEGRHFPSQISVDPDPGSALAKREFDVLEGANPSQFDKLEPRTADAGLPDLDADALIELAGLTDPEAGVLISPHKPAHLVGVRENAVILSQVGEAEHLSEQGELLEAQAEDKRRIEQRVVLSSRLATGLGLAQSAMEEAQKAEQRSETARKSGAVAIAALAAALDVEADQPDQPALQALRHNFGHDIVKKSLRSARKEDQEEEEAVRFAQRMLAQLPEKEVPFIVEAVSESYSPQQAGVGEKSLQMLRQHAQGDQTVVALGGAYLAGRYHQENDQQQALESFTADLSEAAGEMVLREEARQIIAATPGSQEVEDLRNADYASAAISIKGRRWRSMMEDVLESMPEDVIDKWWATFDQHMREDELRLVEDGNTEVPEKLAYEDPQQGILKSGRPTAGDIKLPSSLREKWLRECQLNVQGRIWQDEDGRVYAGFGDAKSGTITLSDIARRPDPEQFPVRNAQEIEDARRQGRVYDFKTELHSEDLRPTTQRIGSLSLGEERLEGSRETLFVGRWVPPKLLEQRERAGQEIDDIDQKHIKLTRQIGMIDTEVHQLTRQLAEVETVLQYHQAREAPEEAQQVPQLEKELELLSAEEAREATPQELEGQADKLEETIQQLDQRREQVLQKRRLLGEVPEGDVPQIVEGELETHKPHEVFIGEGDDQRRFELVRPKADEAVSVEEAGTLRVFGFTREGEKLLFELPMREVGPGTRALRKEVEDPAQDLDEPVAFALDAEQIAHLTDFVTTKGRSTTLGVSDGLVRIYDGTRSRMVVMPTIAATEVPRELTPMVSAAGADHQPEPVELEEVFDRIQQLAQERRQQPQTSQAEPDQEVIRDDQRTRYAEGAIEFRREAPDQAPASPEAAETQLGFGQFIDVDAESVARGETHEFKRLQAYKQRLMEQRDQLEVREDQLEEKLQAISQAHEQEKEHRVEQTDLLGGQGEVQTEKGTSRAEKLQGRLRSLRGRRGSYTTKIKQLNELLSKLQSLSPKPAQPGEVRTGSSDVALMGKDRPTTPSEQQADQNGRSR